MKPYLHPSDQQRRNRLLLIAGIVAAALLVTVLVSIISNARRANVANFQITSTNLKSGSNFGYLQGDNVYAYNNLAFYRTNIKTGKLEVLNSGARLPRVKQMFWVGSKGVIMVFRDSFARTIAEDELDSQGLLFDATTRDFSWYLDFSTGKLTVISKAAILDGKTYYSAANSQFYYTQERPSGSSTVAALYRFDPTTTQVSRLASNLDLQDTGNLNSCSPASAVCLTGRKAADLRVDRLYAFSNEGKAKELLKVTGDIYTANRKDLYTSAEYIGQAPRTIEEQDDVTRAPVKLHNIATGKAHELDVTIDEGDVIASFVSDSDFFIADNSIKGTSSRVATGLYYGGKYNATKNAIGTVDRKLIYSDKKPFKSWIMETNGQNSSGTSLVTTGDGNQQLFSLQPLTTKKVASSKDTLNVTKQCAKEISGTSEYLSNDDVYVIYVDDDGNFADHTKKIGNCMSKQSAVLYGHNFSYVGIDPDTGRSTTD